MNDTLNNTEPIMNFENQYSTQNDLSARRQGSSDAAVLNIQRGANDAANDAEGHFAKSIKKILVCRTDFIGDMVLSTPIFESLKNYYPQAEIYVLCKALVKPLLADNPYIKDILIEDSRGLWKQSRAIKAYKFDMFLSIWENPYYAWLGFFSKIKYRVGFSVNLSSFLLYTHKTRFPWKDNTLHQVDINLSLLKAVGIEPKKNIIPKLYSHKNQNNSLASATNSTQKNLNDEVNAAEGHFKNKVVIAVGARGANKLWTPDGFTEVIKFILTNTHLNVELIGGPEEKKIGLFFKNKFTDKRIINNVAKLSLEKTMQTISAASYFIGADSGPMHIAAAYGIPLLGLFITKNQKPTRWSPYNTKHLMLVAEYKCPFICRSSKCTLDICTKSITPKMVIGSFIKLMKGQGKLNDDLYRKQSGYRILLLGKTKERIEKQNQKLRGFKVHHILMPQKLSVLKKYIVVHNINIVYLLDYSRSWKWLLFQIRLSNYLPSYPLFLYGNNSRNDHNLRSTIAQ